MFNLKMHQIFILILVFVGKTKFEFRTFRIIFGYENDWFIIDKFGLLLEKT